MHRRGVVGQEGLAENAGQQEGETVSRQAELIAEVPKNRTEVIRVQRTTFRRMPLVDARVWTVPAVPGDEGKPTKKGLTLRPETWAELVEIIRRETGGSED